MKYVYPAIFSPIERGGYAIWFPDLPGTNSQGEDWSTCLTNAQNALECWLDFLLDEKEPLPPASNPNAIAHDEKEIVTLISADVERFRRLRDNRAVKKTLTLPAWVDEAAKEAGVNFSQTLQKALIQELGIDPKAG